MSCFCFHSDEERRRLKAIDTYGHIYHRVNAAKKTQRDQHDQHLIGNVRNEEANGTADPIESSALVPVQNQNIDGFASGSQQSVVAYQQNNTTSTQQLIRAPKKMARPTWHAPWQLKRVLSGHHGWVRCVAVDPTNEWIATGAADRVIKVWDLASGLLKISLTGTLK